MGISTGTIKRRVAVSLLLVAAQCCGIAVMAIETHTLGDLQRSYADSRAFAEGNPAASSYRAGRFDGYLRGVAEILQARGEICLPGCFCQLDEVFAPRLEVVLKDASLMSLPAQPWLTEQLRQAFPCPAK